MRRQSGKQKWRVSTESLLGFWCKTSCWRLTSCWLGTGLVTPFALYVIKWRRQLHTFAFEVFSGALYHPWVVWSIEGVI
jgi:hypothetical protein